VYIYGSGQPYTCVKLKLMSVSTSCTKSSLCFLSIAISRLNRGTHTHCTHACSANCVQIIQGLWYACYSIRASFPTSYVAYHQLKSKVCVMHACGSKYVIFMLTSDLPPAGTIMCVFLLMVTISIHGYTPCEFRSCCPRESSISPIRLANQHSSRASAEGIAEGML